MSDLKDEFWRKVTAEFIAIKVYKTSFLAFWGLLSIPALQIRSDELIEGQIKQLG